MFVVGMLKFGCIYKGVSGTEEGEEKSKDECDSYGGS